MAIAPVFRSDGHRACIDDSELVRELSRPVRGPYCSVVVYRDCVNGCGVSPVMLGHSETSLSRGLRGFSTRASPALRRVEMSRVRPQQEMPSGFATARSLQRNTQPQRSIARRWKPPHRDKPTAAITRAERFVHRSRQVHCYHSRCRSRAATNPPSLDYPNENGCARLLLPDTG